MGFCVSLISLPGTDSPMGFDFTRKRAIMNRGKDGLANFLPAWLAITVVSAIRRDLYRKEASEMVFFQRYCS